MDLVKCLVIANTWRILNMAGVPGFEPGYAGIKIRCLTAWLHPNLAGIAQQHCAFFQRQQVDYEEESGTGRNLCADGFKPALHCNTHSGHCHGKSVTLACNRDSREYHPYASFTD